MGGLAIAALHGPEVADQGALELCVNKVGGPVESDRRPRCGGDRLVVATRSQAPSPPTRQPASSITTIDQSLIASTIPFGAGTRSVPVVWAAEQIALAAMGTPRWPTRLADLATVSPRA